MKDQLDTNDRNRPKTGIAWGDYDPIRDYEESMNNYDNYDPYRRNENW